MQCIAVAALAFVTCATSPRALAEPVVAGAAAGPAAALTSFSEYWALSPAARSAAVAYRVDCDVLFYDAAWGTLWVRDARGPTYLDPGPEALPIRHGQRIRLSGVFPPGAGGPALAGATVEALGQAELVPMVVGDRLTRDQMFHNQYVQLDGLVDQQMMTDASHMFLALVAEGRAVSAWVQIEGPATPPDFAGRVVRVRGVYNPRLTPGGDFASLELMVPGVAGVEVLSRLEEDPDFDLPAVPIAELPRLPPTRRVRVVGEVHAQSPGRELRLRDETGQVSVMSAQTTILPLREKVEAIGLPDVGGTDWRLEAALFRRSQASPRAAAVAPPAPEGVRVARIQDFWDLSAAERMQPQRIDLECEVLHYDPIWGMLWVGDAGGGAFVKPLDRPFPIRAGQRIHISGTLTPPNTDLSFVNATVTVVGEGSIMPVPLGDWHRLNPALRNRLVYADGLVDRQTTSTDDPTHLRLFLSVDGRPLTAWVLKPAQLEAPDFTGAIVRVSGIYNPRATEQDAITALELMVPALDRVEVLGQLATDPRFQRPAVPLDRLRGVPGDRLVRVVGEVHGQQPGRSLRLRDPGGQVDVISAQTTRLSLHERVEAVGRVRSEGVDVQLVEAVFRPLGPAEAGSGRTGARAGLSTLHLAADVLELGPADAEQAVPVQLTGVITWSHPDCPYFFLQDSSGGVRVQRGADRNRVRPPGRSVAVRGRTAMGGFAPEVVADSVEKISEMALPEAPVVSLEHALTGVEEARWVEMRGYVRALEHAANEHGVDEQVLRLATGAGDFEAVLPSGDDVGAVTGAIVRLRGVCVARTDAESRLTGIVLRVPDASFVQIDEPAAADPFEITARSLGSLGRFATTQAFNRRVKVEGTVVYAAPGRFVVHAEGASLVVLTRESNLPVPGQHIEAVGILGRQGPRVVLREAVHRTMGAGTQPDPAALQVPTGPDTASDGQLVRTSALVLDAVSVNRTLVLTLQQGAAVFPAHLERASVAVAKGSRVELTGVYEVQYDEYGQPRGFALLLRDPADLVLLEPPSPFTIRRVLTFTGFLAVGTLGIVLWVLALRRRVRQQTGQIRAQLEREAHLQHELERAQRLEALGLLAGGIAHDFNNLLTVILGNISLARDDRGLEEETRQSLADAERALGRARDLTQQLLTFSKGGAPIRSAVDLAGVVREVAEFVLHGLPVQAEFHLDPEVWPADVDKGQVGQVVQNIVINAAQAMPDGGRVDIALANDAVPAGARPNLAAGRYLRLTIRDRGRGIDPKDLPRIFDPYFTTKRQGSGLGLATVYSIVRRHGGDVAVESTIGEGTCFRIWLPAADAAPAHERAPAPAPARHRAGPSPQRPAARVLVMDDEPDIRRLSQSILRRAGYDVTTVPDGAAAVREYASAAAAGRGYALVILDLTVPGGMGGRQAIEAVRRIDPHVRAIVSSGYSSDPSLANHRELGFSAMVPKPYEAAALLEAVEAVLREGPAPAGAVV